MRVIKNLPVRKKINTILFLFGFFLLLGCIIPSYWTGIRILEKVAFEKLRTISNLKQQDMEDWEANIEGVIQGISNSPDLQNYLSLMYRFPERSARHREAEKALMQNLNVWRDAESGFETLSVIDWESGIVISSTIPEEVGKDVSGEPFFMQARTGLTVQNPYMSELLRVTTVRFALPFRVTEGLAKAVLSARVNMEKIDQIIQRGIEGNSSLDVYLVNHEKRVIVSPKYKPGLTVLRDSVESEVIDQCVQGQSGEISGKDYRGIPVVASYLWKPEWDMCLVVEMDRVEANREIRQFTGIVIVAFLAVIILGFILSRVLSGLITSPLFRILHGVELIGNGDLDHRIGYDNGDEVGMLSLAINRLAANFSSLLVETRKTSQENLRLYEEASTHARQIEEEQVFISKIFDNSSNLIVVLDRHGRVVRHNRACEVLTGLPYAEIHERKYQDLQNTLGMKFPNSLERTDELRSNFQDFLESEMLSASGEKKHIAWKTDVILDGTGEVEYYLSVGLDVTELKRVEEALRDSTWKFRTALATAPISVATLDRDFRITFFQDPNPHPPQAEMLDKRVDEIYKTGEITEIMAILENAIQTGEAQRGQIVIRIHGKQKYFLYNIDPIRDATGSIEGLACAGYEITQLKKTEQELVGIKNHLEQLVVERTQELSRNQFVLQAMVDAIPEVVVLLDSDGNIITGNKMMAERLGVPIEQLIGAYLYDFFPPDVAAHRLAMANYAMSTGKTMRYTDTREGHYYQNLATPIIDKENQVSVLSVIAFDVTDWINAQNAIAAGRERLKDLARKVVFAQEEERRRISSELHDEAGQALTALTISLKIHYDDLPDRPAELKSKVLDTISLVKSTSEKIRLLAQGLRPLALDALGINNTLEGFCRDFSRRTQIPIEYQGVDVEPLLDIIGISFYRFLQEALTNVAKHSRATQVKVKLALQGDILMLSVEDNGIGFEVEPVFEQMQKNGKVGIGLVGLRERVEMIGGKMEVFSAPGKGSTLVAMVSIMGDVIDRRRKNDPSRYR